MEFEFYYSDTILEVSVEVIYSMLAKLEMANIHLQILHMSCHLQWETFCKLNLFCLLALILP